MRCVGYQVRTRQHKLHDEVLLDVQLPIAALAGRNGAADDVAFQLLDTPGPNESGECDVAESEAQPPAEILGVITHQTYRMVCHCACSIISITMY